MDNPEPYRATRLWNEVIAAFQSGMPLKRHRRRIQTYNNCFMASEAVTWLHCYLLNNPNFGSDVSREQTANLLRKFLKCHVIESVFVRSKKKDFADDSNLYRFTPVSSYQSRPSALCLIQSPSFGARNANNKDKKKIEKLTGSPEQQKENLPECHLIEKKLSPSEEKLAWKRVTFARLEKVWPFSQISDFADEKEVDGLLVKHNVTRLSKSGVVCLTDKTDDIPHWVISAMKCLTNWPNASGSGSCLPNYPGFEKDVFKVVRDFFINPQTPLLTDFVTPLLLKVFCYYICDKAETNLYNGTPSSNSSRSALIVKTSTPVLNTSSNMSPTNETGVLDKTADGKILLDDPEAMWEFPSVIYYETDFGTSNPVTRMVSGELTPRSCANSVGSIESVSTISMCSQGQKSLSKTSLCSRGRRSVTSFHSSNESQGLRSGNLINSGLRSVSTMSVRSPIGNANLFGSSLTNLKSPLKQWSSNLYLQDEVKESVEKYSPMNFPKIRSANSLGRVFSNSQQFVSDQNVYLCEINDLNTSDLSSRTITEDNVDEIHSREASLNNMKHSASAIFSKISSPVEQYSQRSVLSNKHIRNNKKLENPPEELKLAFQVILLFLPSPNRRQLHLLLRLISKIVKNGKFVLDLTVPMRNHLLEIFLPAIIRSDEYEGCLNPLASFMLDNCEWLFQPPLGLKEEVEEYSRSCFGRIRYSVDETCFLTYCEMVSKQQYEEQTIVLSSGALKDLLNSIIHDRNLSEKDRKRKLKQFKTCHPDVYYLRFPEKQETKSTFLYRLANLRM